MQNDAANTNSTPAPKKQFTKEEREAFIQKKNETRKTKLIEAGYTEEIANNIVAYAKQHRGYGPKDGRHGGDWLVNAMTGIVYGFKFKLRKFTKEEVMKLNGNCLAFLDSLARLDNGEELVDDDGNKVTVESLIDAYTTPKTTEGRLMYALGHRCEPIDEAKTGRKDFGPGSKANRLHYLCEAVIELLVTNADTFAAFYHEEPMDDPNHPRVHKCRICKSELVQNSKGFWDCRNPECEECRDENGKFVNKKFDRKANVDLHESAGEFVPDAPHKDSPRRQFNNKNREKFDPSKYKGGKKKFKRENRFEEKERRQLNTTAFDCLNVDADGNITLK